MAIEHVLFFDTETTGLDATKDQVIEVAAILYSLTHRAPLASYASVVYAESNAAFAVNKIPEPLLRMAPPPPVVWGRIEAMAGWADAIIAHRAEFDYKFSPPSLQTSKPWVCSKFDLTWPGTDRMGEHLIHLAVAHDVAVVQAHRALTDCDTLMRLFQQCAARGHDMAAAVARGMRPKKLFYSNTSFAQNELVKKHGFAFDMPTHGKNWYRWMPPEDVSSLPFPVRLIATQPSLF